MFGSPAPWWEEAYLSPQRFLPAQLGPTPPPVMGAQGFQELGKGVRHLQQEVLGDGDHHRQVGRGLDQGLCSQLDSWGRGRDPAEKELPETSPTASP